MPLDLDQIQTTALAEFVAASDAAAVEALRIRYLGTKGLLKDVLAGIKDVPGPDKKAFGQRINALKDAVQAALDEATARTAASKRTAGPVLDLTRPGIAQPVGHEHILAATQRELTAIFQRLGFMPVSGPEVEDEFHNFDALNIPRGHPARDEADNFFLQQREPDGTARPLSLLLRSQTSTIQIRAVEKYGVPLRVVAPGRVYRPDSVDATHHFMFTQIEGLAIDKGLTLRDLKGVLEAFLKEFFGSDTKYRLRPHYFPFTEVSAEVDINCAALSHLRKEWLEILGCGMVHPNVLRAVGVDPEVYTGFAWGMGVERIAMLRHQIGDIRHFFEGDVRFLHQFG
jgi:phenylalanyl-tRNA synthetase alpha chain